MKPAVDQVGSAPAATVFVVDDDASMREALCRLMRSVDLHVEPFSSAGQFLCHQVPETPACLVLDVRLPDFSGLELQQKLAASNNRIPIIFITGHGDIPMTVRAMKAGAIEFLTKPFRDQDLLDAVLAAIAKDREMIQARAEIAKLRRRFARLTAREKEVMALVVQGRMNKQIAAELGTSEITIKIHRAQVMQKMEAESLPDLVRMAEQVAKG
ncbi:MAG: response regulator transcription factor [Candidatus Methylacidiphilales bacterium]|nr:response regulator transcription factor [Candidatus Methylacidiphilales bacterium]